MAVRRNIGRQAALNVLLLQDQIMRGSALFLTVAFCVSMLIEAAFVEAALAQGTKDPSTPVPSMVVPIRPRDEPTRPTAVPNHNRTFPPQPVIRMRRAYRPYIYR